MARSLETPNRDAVRRHAALGVLRDLAPADVPSFAAAQRRTADAAEARLLAEAVAFVDRHLAVTAAQNTTPSPAKLAELVHEAIQRCDRDPRPHRPLGHPRRPGPASVRR